jgi:predicted transcriptional regulator
MVVQDDTLLHYGTKRHSGRYPWGSGQSAYEHDPFLSRVYMLREQGLGEKDIAEKLGMNTSKLRSTIALSNEKQKQEIAKQAKALRDQGMSHVEIGKQLGVSEGSVRNYLTNKQGTRRNQIENTVNTLKEAINEHPYLDVGTGVDLQMGISRQKLKAAIAQLQTEGYYQHEIYIPQVGNAGKWTTVRVLTKEPNIENVKAHKYEVQPPSKWTEDGGLTFNSLRPIQLLDKSRVGINYGDKGGEDRDGLIQVRRGVKDLDLGANHYAQVRIGVEGGSYLKGMAMYSDNMPAGKDVVFNTNKHSGTPMEKVLKPLKGPANDPNMAFGATITHQKGAFNIVNSEGDWANWNGSKFPSQFLSKQPISLVKDRLKSTYDSLNSEYKEIHNLTNPIVKKHLLEEYANDLDSKTRHLKVQGLPRTKAHVLLPFPDMKPNEVYAPNYKDGENVVLIRYPHGGTFEIPELKVNNRTASAKKALGNVPDAIGIHPSVAHKLSGADFDGDAVYVIPNNNKRIKATSSLKDLKNFDPNSYSVNHKTISSRQKQTMMGEVSNLITDMTIKGASVNELTRAVRHSMVVIDSEKHQLDWKQSAIDNGIAALRKKYQARQSIKYDPETKTITKGRTLVGASTLISRSKSQIETSSTKVKITDPETGKTRTVKRDISKTPLMDLVSDAHTLSSGTAVENAYADYINKLKAISNQAKKESYSIKPITRDKEMAKLYSDQVKSLGTKLTLSLSNAPRERRAQVLANKLYSEQVKPDMNNDQKKKLKARSLATARTTAHAQRTNVDITPIEWEAIQNHAISNTMLEQILLHTDSDAVKKLATPKPETKLTSSKIDKAKTLLSNGYTYAQVANSLGISTTTLYSAVKGGA